MIELKPWCSIGEEEAEAAQRVVRSGLLSGFLGGRVAGGPEVEALETEWSEQSGGYAIAVNSATSGILIALKALGVGYGDKVICSPYSMSAGVAAIFWCGATPVFADIDDTYCLDPTAVMKAMSRDVRAILTTNLFGNVTVPPDTDTPIVEDNAQAVFSHEQFGSILIESYNCHKPLNAGEGGICVTPDMELAKTLKLLRNHGEIAGEYPGLNLRMVEVTAAIAREQLKKGGRIVSERNALIGRFIRGIQDLPGLRLLEHDPSNTYYALPIRCHAQLREQLLGELNTRGVPLTAGYGGPLYRLPAFKSYATKCPHCELLDRELMLFEPYKWHLDESDIDQMINVFRQVLHEIS